MFAWVLVFIFGISIFMGIFQKRFQKFPAVMCSLIIAFICSIILLFLYYSYPDEIRTSYKILTFMIGELMFVFGIHNIYAFFQCRTAVNATYIKYNTYYGGRGITTQSPVFEYSYKGLDYLEQSTHTESLKYLNQNMRIGDNYTIYINHKNPNVFILRKKIGFINILMLAIGLFFLLGLTFL